MGIKSLNIDRYRTGQHFSNIIGTFEQFLDYPHGIMDLPNLFF